MLTKITLALYLEVEDDGQAERACSTLGSLDTVLTHQVAFPEGEPVHTEVDRWELVGDDEAERLGLVE